MGISDAFEAHVGSHPERSYGNVINGATSPSLRKYYDHSSGKPKPSPFPSRAKETADPYLFDGVELKEAIADKPKIAWNQGGFLSGSYSPINETECAIVSVENAEGTVVIPQELDGHRVVAIAPQACTGNESITELQIPGSVRYIGYKAFAYSKSLQHLSLEEGAEYLDDYAFMGCGFANLATPLTLKTIGIRTFSQCSNLREVDLNEGLLFIGEEAFAKTKLKTIFIPSTVERIGARIIKESDHVSDVRLHVDPKNPLFLSDEFGFGLYMRGIDGLTMLSLYGNPHRYVINPHTKIIGPHAFALHPDLESVELPNGLLRIDEGAFRGCRNLAQIKLPNTLEEIGGRALFDTGISHIYLPRKLSKIADSSLLIHSGRDMTLNSTPLVIEVDPENPYFYINGGVLCRHLDIGASKAIMYAGTQHRVEIPKNVTQLGEYVFYGALGIDELVIHDGIEPFDPHAFIVVESIQHVIVNLIEPVEGRSQVDFYFAQDNAHRSNFIYTFNCGTIDIVRMRFVSDAGILIMPNQFMRECIALQRLHDPFMLESRRKKELSELIRINLKAACTDFAINHYNDGYTQLFDLKFINEENVNDVVEWVRDTGNIAAASFVMELKRRYLGMDSFSEYDL